MFYRFNHLDPKAGQMPAHLSSRFFEILYRARLLLTHRSTEEIQSGAAILQSLTRHPNYQNLDHARLDLESASITLPDGETVEAWPVANEVSQIAHQIDRIKLADFTELSKCQWHELLALAALSFADRAIAIDQIQNEPLPAWLGGGKRPSAEEQIEQLASMGREALSLAESLQRQSKLRSEGGKQKHASLAPLKQTVQRTAADKFSARSARDAAKHVFNELEESGKVSYDPISKRLEFEGKHVATNDDPARQFEKWIGEDRKDQR